MMLPLYISTDRNPNDPVNPVKMSPLTISYLLWEGVKWYNSDTDQYSARNLRQRRRQLDRINRINMMLPLYISTDRNPNDPVNPVRTSPRSLLIYAREASALAQKSPGEGSSAKARGTGRGSSKSELAWV
jgi:hypothetical protein